MIESSDDGATPQGFETGQFGWRLTSSLEQSINHRGWQIFYDHGDRKNHANVATNKAFYGPNVENGNRLSDVDVLVVSPDGVVRLVIEIEERECVPKKIWGDLAVLMCNQVAVRMSGRAQVFQISPKETQVIVAGIVPDCGKRLTKIMGLMQSRIVQFGGCPDGISPKNVALLFCPTIEQTVERLYVAVEKTLGIKI